MRVWCYCRLLYNQSRKGRNTRNALHRFLWEHKVARKVKVCKLLSQLLSCTLIMGTKSCSKIFQTFAFDINRALGGKSLQTFATFCHGKSCDKILAAGLQPITPSTCTHSRTHVDPLPPHATHTREIPATDERPSQNTSTTRWIACDGPAV